MFRRRLFIIHLIAFLALWALGLSTTNLRSWNNCIFVCWQYDEAISFNFDWCTSTIVLVMINLIRYISIVMILSWCFEIVNHIISVLNVDDGTHTGHVLPLPQIAHTHFGMRLNFASIISCSCSNAAWIRHSNLWLRRILLKDAKLLVLALSWIHKLLLSLSYIIFLKDTCRRMRLWIQWRIYLWNLRQQRVVLFNVDLTLTWNWRYIIFHSIILFCFWA